MLSSEFYFLQYKSASEVFIGNIELKTLNCNFPKVVQS